MMSAAFTALLPDWLLTAVQQSPDSDPLEYKNCSSVILDNAAGGALIQVNTP
jgi:hypothetical protein